VLPLDPTESSAALVEDELPLVELPLVDPAVVVMAPVE